MPELFPVNMIRSAVFSEDRRYRYVLVRDWSAHLPRVAFVALNPSTADEEKDDPTLRRCIRFARDWGFGSLAMLNLFAFRATDPFVMQQQEDPVGPENDGWIVKCAGECQAVVFCWGVRGTYLGRSAEVLSLGLKNAYAFKMTANGQPWHPLMLRSDEVPKALTTFLDIRRPLALPKDSAMTRRIFVFGSNREGRHGRGAAEVARKVYGALLGQPRGLQGNAYAIVTKELRPDHPKVTIGEIKTEVDEFLAFAAGLPSYEFVVTPIGCGLAGFSPEQIAPLFVGATPNVHLPQEFVEVLQKRVEP